MEEKKKSSWVGFGVVCGLLMALGLFLRFAVVGYSFSALICFCLLGLVVCYKAVSMLARRWRSLARPCVWCWISAWAWAWPWWA